MQRLIVVFLFLFLLLGNLSAKLPLWSYDAGPDPKDPMGKELIDLIANMPDMPEMSLKIIGEQKFRPAFGPVVWRMLQQKNKVKILFIGQDATHIAEAAGRPATAGFGGRAQDLAAYFGVNEGAAFINTYAYTIKGQYGAYQTPYLYQNNEGKWDVRFSNLVDSRLWLTGHDPKGPIAAWRNKLIDWIIRNNRDSLKMIVAFGGAARDSVASFVISKGGKVYATNEKNMKRIQVPETDLAFAGGNNEYPYLLSQTGGDLYAEVLGRKINYENENEQKFLQKDIKENLDHYLSKMVFAKGGAYHNGLYSPAQLGGYNLNQIYLNNNNTRSLRGIKLNDNTELDRDVLVVELPHPTFLSNLGKEEASKAVKEDLQVLKPYVEKGWEITADEGMENHFSKGEDYVYSRAEIGPEYYDFGTPKSRMVSVSSASRMPGAPHAIIFGTRDRVRFDKELVEKLTEASPNQEFNDEELFITRPRGLKHRYTFDMGPGAKWAKLMKENLNFKALYRTKPGMKFEENGIDAYYIKSHPDHGDFGHYRGTFNNPEVLVLADPIGNDDLLTGKAITGERGQYLQGLLSDMGIAENYLVFKTVPFGMENASYDDWNYVLSNTKEYRDAVLGELANNHSLQLILADGPYAIKEAERIFKGQKIAIVNINRSENGHEFDIKEAAKNLKKLETFNNVNFHFEAHNIPRAHLSFYARTWEGTCGDRVISAEDKYKGLAFAVVAPAWAFKQQHKKLFNESSETENALQMLEQNGQRLPKESIPEFIQRVGIEPFVAFIFDVIKKLGFVA